MTRVQTQHTSNGLKFILDNGKSLLYSDEFSYKGRDYYFLGNVYYDLEDELIAYIYKKQLDNEDN